MSDRPKPTAVDGITLRWLAAYHGPSTMADEPVVVAELSGPGALSADAVRAACRRLEALCPLDPRNQEATPIAQPEPEDGLLLLGRFAAAWTLAALNEVRGFLHDAGARRSESGVLIWLGFHDMTLSRQALEFSLHWLGRLLREEVPDGSLQNNLERLWAACRARHPDYQARILMVGARALGVPFMRYLPDSKYWQFGWGARSRVFMESSSNADGQLGWQWQRNKVLGRRVIRALGFPAPEHVLVSRSNDLDAALASIGYPCVIKPRDGGGGKGVTANLHEPEAARRAFDLARSSRKGPIIVEQHLPGWDHRLMVIDGRFVAAIRREPAWVEGNGVDSLSTLIAAANRQRTSNLAASNYHRFIELDAALEAHLLKQRLRLSDVVPAGHRVTLRSNANLSTGGLCTDLTGETHQGVREMAEQLAASVGLATAGLDYMTLDISQPPLPGNGAFIEMNTTPGLDACVAAGWQEERIARLVLGDCPGTLTIDLEVLAHEALAGRLDELERKQATPDEGWVCADSGRVGSAPLAPAEAEPWPLVRSALRNRRLRRLKIACSGEDIIRLGAPVPFLSSVEIRDAALTDEWLAVLQRLTCAATRDENQAG